LWLAEEIFQALQKSNKTIDVPMAAALRDGHARVFAARPI
jgi:hypothetical protein